MHQYIGYHIVIHQEKVSVVYQDSRKNIPIASHRLAKYQKSKIKEKTIYDPRKEIMYNNLCSVSWNRVETIRLSFKINELMIIQSFL